MNFAILHYISWCLIGLMPEKKEQTWLEKHNLPFEINNILESWISLKNESALVGSFSAFWATRP